MTRRDLLALVPRVERHPTNAVVDGVTYPEGLAQYERETGNRPDLPTILTKEEN